MELIDLLSSYSLEVVLIALGCFLLTEVIKLPIKKATARLDEDKRKMVNIVIMLIPLVLSCVASVLYYGIAYKTYFSMTVLSCVISSYVLSLSMYAIFSRIWLVIKGIYSGKVSYNDELTKDAISYIKGKLKELLKSLKIDEKDLASILSSFEDLSKQKELLSADKVCIDLEKIAEINSELDRLSAEKTAKEASIAQCKEKIEKYNAELYKKNDNV